MTGTVLGTAR